MTRHPRLSQQRLLNAIHRRETSLDNPGFCRLCGCEADGCEPDAEDYDCDDCGEPAVCSPEVLLGVI